MLVISKNVYKLMIASKELVDDNKKNELGQWIPTGTKSDMCKYIFKGAGEDLITFSSKNTLHMTDEGRTGYIVLEVKQFGSKKPEAKFVSFQVEIPKK